MSLSREKLAQLKRKSKALEFFGGENNSKAIINKYIFDGGTSVEPIVNAEIREADKDAPSIKAISSNNVKIKYIIGNATAPKKKEEIFSFSKLPRGSFVDVFDVIPTSTLEMITKDSKEDLLTKEYKLATLDKIKRRVKKFKAKTGPIKVDDSELEKKFMETYTDELEDDAHIELLIIQLKLVNQVEDREAMEKDVKFKNDLEYEVAQLEKDLKKPNQENKSKKEAELTSAKKNLEEHNKDMRFREKALEEYYNDPDDKEKKNFINKKVNEFKVEERKKKDPEEDKKTKEEEARKLVEEALEKENNRKIKLAQAGVRGAALEEAEKAGARIKAEAKAKADAKAEEAAKAAANPAAAPSPAPSPAPGADGAAPGADTAAPGADGAAPGVGTGSGGGKKRNTRNKRKPSGKTRRKSV